jgi:hypothetical protein
MTRLSIDIRPFLSDLDKIQKITLALEEKIYNSDGGTISPLVIVNVSKALDAMQIAYRIHTEDEDK